MITQVTSGIKVSVEVFYRPDQSSILLSQHIFAYRITITNNSDYSIRLSRRHWFIIDSNATNREVEGEGVVGLQPVIEPGKTHQYVSGSHLKTEIGKMHGTYLMERMNDGKHFKVKIPEFPLIAPFKLN